MTPLNIKTPAEMFDLSGKVAFITGGSRGLGHAMALGFAKAGADVAVASRKLDSCKAAAAEIESLGRKASAHKCHVADWQSLDAVVDEIWAAHGKIDILVNNAGMSPIAPSSVDTSEELFDKVIGVNLKGPFRLMSLVGSRMAAGDGGNIINISSTASIHPTPQTAPYGAAKAGLNILTEAFAHEYGPKVRVNCIMPGPYHTDVSKAWSRTEAFEKRAQETIAMQRAGNPEEIVGAAIYLASDAASFTTGAIIRADGGSK